MSNSLLMSFQRPLEAKDLSTAANYLGMRLAMDYIASPFFAVFGNVCDSVILNLAHSSALGIAVHAQRNYVPQSLPPPM
jgi:hypothetical protein